MLGKTQQTVRYGSAAFDRFQHGIIIVKRFTHSHENNVTHIGSEIFAGGIHLPHNFLDGKVAQKPFFGGFAEPAPHPAPGLTGYANGFVPYHMGHGGRGPWGT